MAGGTPTANARSVTYGGNIYIWGGVAGGVPINTMSIYNIANNSWSSGTSGGTAKSAYAIGLNKGKIYYITGLGDPDMVNSIDIYNTGNQPVFSTLPDDSRTINLDEGGTITTSSYEIKVKPSEGSGITNVVFAIDDTTVCTDTTADANGIYSCVWDTTLFHSDILITVNYQNDTAITLARTVTVSIPTVTPTTTTTISTTASSSTITTSTTTTSTTSSTIQATILPITGAHKIYLFDLALFN